MTGQQTAGGISGRQPPEGRRDAVRNYHRIIDAARDVLGESGADASMEEIAARAGVGVGTVYRRFASKDALIDELLRLGQQDAAAAAELALARRDGRGLEQFLVALGTMFAEHARYAHLLLRRPADDEASQRLRAAIHELTERAQAAGSLNPGVTIRDVMTLIWALRGIAGTTAGTDPGCWQRFLDIHLAGLRAAAPHTAPPTDPSRPSARQPASG